MLQFPDTFVSIDIGNKEISITEKKELSEETITPAIETVVTLALLSPLHYLQKSKADTAMIFMHNYG